MSQEKIYINPNVSSNAPYVIRSYAGKSVFATLRIMEDPEDEDSTVDVYYVNGHKLHPSWYSKTPYLDETAKKEGPKVEVNSSDRGDIKQLDEGDLAKRYPTTAPFYSPATTPLKTSSLLS